MLCVFVLLLLAGQAGAAGPPAGKTKTAAKPVWQLAMDGSRVAYASGGIIRVWDVATAKTSVVRGRYGTAEPSQLAIAGRRVAWIDDRQVGNTEEGEKLYTATAGGRARLLDHVYRHGVDDPTLTTGGWIEGLAGSGKSIAVSTWRSNGELASDQQLSLVGGSDLQPVTSGPDSMVSEAVDGGLIAVLRSSPWSASNTVGIYPAAEGDQAELGEVHLGPSDPDTTGIQIALSGDEVVVLTTAITEPSGPTTVTLRTYDWTTGELLHTWPVGIHSDGGEASMAAQGPLAAVEGHGSLHLVDLETGKDVTFGPASHTDCPPAIDSHGLVYAVNPHLKGPGKLVFVPTAKLLAAVG